ncbi:DUF1295 domain-containing protein [Nocardiopsis coralliicola]
MLAAFAAARRLGRHSVVDVAWGASFAAVAAVTAIASIGDGDPLRTGLACGLAAVWGLRLAVHIARRDHGQGEDPRYEALLSRAPGSRDAYALRTVYLLQGAIVLVVALPVQVAAFAPGPAGPLAAAGAGIWAVGLFFEAVGDAQLARFKADPANRGALMTRGLWAWTRHPNYFGDACVWWGLFLIAADAWPGVLTAVSPLLMTYLLTRGSGKRLLEERMRGRPGWDAYAAATPGFFPLPPGWKRRFLRAG